MHKRMTWSPTRLRLVTIVPTAILLVACPARADSLPIRVDYQSDEECPVASVFLDEVRWRTSLARLADSSEEALEVRARITTRGSVSTGKLVLSSGTDQIKREISSASCDEVVSALALITALAVDPHASTGKLSPRPAPPPPPVFPAKPAHLPASAPPPPFLSRLPPSIMADPLPALLSISDTPRLLALRRWAGGVHATVAFAVTPSPLLGGGLFVERALAPRWGGSLRAAIEVGLTGAGKVGLGSASFVRGLLRVDTCAFAARPAQWFSLVPCVSAEGGALRGAAVGNAVNNATVTAPSQATVPWVSVGLLPRATIDLGGVVLDVQGGPVFPLIRRSFIFRFRFAPDETIYDVPPVTWMVSVGAGGRFP